MSNFALANVVLLFGCFVVWLFCCLVVCIVYQQINKTTKC